MKTKQMLEWGSEFGKAYTDRGPKNPEEVDKEYIEFFGITRSSLDKEFLEKLDKETKILEVGCNVGSILQGLQNLGFKHLYGIELQDYAVEMSKNYCSHINIIQGSAFDIPFKDNYFDLVYTSGVLIHISPDDIKQAMQEIYRCSNRYIWGCEYFAEQYTAVESYRDKNDLLWKTDFAALYQSYFPDLKLIKQKQFKYLANDNVDVMYLLEKQS